jgi:hypothetical protein
VGICDQPGNGWAVVLRRRPARIVESQPEGGYIGAEFRAAVRLDFGTLYPVARFDLRDEPRIVSAPPAGGCLTPVEWR